MIDESLRREAERIENPGERRAYWLAVAARRLEDIANPNNDVFTMSRELAGVMELLYEAVPVRVLRAAATILPGMEVVCPDGTLDGKPIPAVAVVGEGAMGGAVPEPYCEAGPAYGAPFDSHDPNDGPWDVHVLALKDMLPAVRALRTHERWDLPRTVTFLRSLPCVIGPFERKIDAYQLETVLTDAGVTIEMRPHKP